MEAAPRAQAVTAKTIAWYARLADNCGDDAQRRSASIYACKAAISGGKAAVYGSKPDVDVCGRCRATVIEELFSLPSLAQANLLPSPSSSSSSSAGQLPSVRVINTARSQARCVLCVAPDQQTAFIAVRGSVNAGARPPPLYSHIAFVPAHRLRARTPASCPRTAFIRRTNALAARNGRFTQMQRKASGARTVLTSFPSFLSSSSFLSLPLSFLPLPPSSLPPSSVSPCSLRPQSSSSSPVLRVAAL
eukprot:2250054-Rhodomonas_salina.1